MLVGPALNAATSCSWISFDSAKLMNSCAAADFFDPAMTAAVSMPTMPGLSVGVMTLTFMPWPIRWKALIESITCTGASPVFMRSWLRASVAKNAAMFGLMRLSRSWPFCQFFSSPPSISALIVMMCDGSKSGMPTLPLSRGSQRSAHFVISPCTWSGRYAIV